MVLKRKEVKRDNEWIQQNQQYCQRLVDEYQLFEAELDRAKEVFLDWDFDGLLGNVLEVDPNELGTLLGEVGDTISEWRKVLELGAESAARLALNEPPQLEQLWQLEWKQVQLWLGQLHMLLLGSLWDCQPFSLSWT